MKEKIKKLIETKEEIVNELEKEYQNKNSNLNKAELNILIEQNKKFIEELKKILNQEN